MPEKIKEYYYILLDVSLGIYNKFLYKFGFLEADIVESYEEKKKFCTTNCPLSGYKFGSRVCDDRKEFEGERGCGCFLGLKLFTDSPCPLDKF